MFPTHQQPALPAASCRSQRLASPSVSALAEPPTGYEHPDPAERVLSGLDPEQQRVVLAPVGPVCVLAGAGTGKTRAITRRVAHQVVTGQLPAEQVLTVTFTARAAGELRSRLRQLGADGVQARTFHAAALRQLGYFWPQVMGGALPQLVSSKARLVAQAARAARVTLQGPALRDVTAEIEWAKATMVGPGEYAAAAAAHLARSAARGGCHLQHLHGVRGGEAPGRHDRFRGSAPAHGRPHRGAPVRRRRDACPVSPLRGRRVPGRQPASAPAADGLAGRPRQPVRGGGPGATIYSFTGASSSYLKTFPAALPAGRGVRLVRNYQ